MAPWGGQSVPIDDTEATPIMHPVKMELAPHARLGRRVNAIFAIMILLVFHTTLVVAGLLNWDVPCEYHLSRFLVAYGGVGLGLVYLLLREYLYYSRIGTWPSTTSFVCLVVMYALLCGAGIVLVFYTFKSKDSCRITAPLLYRWCFAAALFFAAIFGLCLLVPLVRVGARCILAPIALCCISCVETVGMDVDVGVGVYGDGYGDGEQGTELTPEEIKARKKAAQKQFIPAALSVCGSVLCAPFYFLLGPIFSVLCKPFSFVFFKAAEACGCVSVTDDGELRFSNPFADCTCAFMVRHATQCIMAPGCMTPGRSLVGLFVNCAALLWFFLYILFELYNSWNLTCERAVPDVAFVHDPMAWLKAGAPSPIHWLILVFAVVGVVGTLYLFISDLFSAPLPPPRSAYEVKKWKVKRQIRVCSYLLLFALFCVWGGFFMYFSLSMPECAESAPSLHRLSLLLLLLFLVLIGLAGIMCCCVTVDCCVSGRARLVLLLSDPQPVVRQGPRISSYGTGGAGGWVPGMPGGPGGPLPGLPGMPGMLSMQAVGPMGGNYYVGAVDETMPRTATEDPSINRRVEWAPAPPEQQFIDQAV